jgi:hypothetical protein
MVIELATKSEMGVVHFRKIRDVYNPWDSKNTPDAATNVYSVISKCSEVPDLCASHDLSQRTPNHPLIRGTAERPRAVLRPPGQAHVRLLPLHLVSALVCPSL